MKERRETMPVSNWPARDVGPIVIAKEESERGKLMRLKFIIGSVALILIAIPVQALAQRSQEISGKTCAELFRSCFRICAVHKGEPAYNGCEADCNGGQRSCISTGLWQSKRATLKIDSGAGAGDVSMLCKTSPGGRGIVRGYVELTLSNLTASAIPKGKVLFAQKGKKTVKLHAAEAIPPNGSATFRTSARAFMGAGECRGWY